jgi:hypothetical protein
MKEVTWTITKVDEQTGDIVVKFTDGVNIRKRLYKWNNDKDIFIQKINNDAIHFAKEYDKVNSILLSTKLELLNSTGSTNSYSSNTDNTDNTELLITRNNILYYENVSDSSIPINI